MTVPRGHESVPDHERSDISAADSDFNVRSALDTMSRKFDELALQDDARERVDGVKREMFWLYRELEKAIENHSEAERHAWRQERTEIYRRCEVTIDEFYRHDAEDTEDFVDILTVYKTELEGLLERLQPKNPEEPKDAVEDKGLK